MCQAEGSLGMWKTQGPLQPIFLEFHVSTTALKCEIQNQKKI